MNARGDANEHWDANLRAMTETMDVPAGAPREIRERCIAVLKGDIKVKTHQQSWRTAVFSTIGVAAAIIVLFGFLGLPHGQTEVNAAVILRALNEQVQASEGIEVSIESLVLDGVAIDGRIQFCRQGVGGDIKVDVQEGNDRPAFAVDATIGIQRGSGWVLVRELKMGDPSMQAVVGMFIPPGRETLITLPMDEDDFDLDAEMGEFKDHDFAQLVEALIEIHEEVGATIEHQPDGTILLTLPIKDTETLEALSRLDALAKGQALTIGGGVGNKGVDISVSVSSEADADRGEAGADIPEHIQRHHADSGHELVGATVKVLYDPAASDIRWFSIEDFGEANGRISVSFEQGAIDATRLDKASVMTEDVHVVDLSAFASLFKDHQPRDGDRDEDDD